MRAAVIESGKVTNIVLVDSLGVLPNLVDAGSANIGDLWDGVSFTPAPPAPKNREELKAERGASVAEIKVTISTGKTFDGDEVSQTRMSRAIVGMQAAGLNTITWVLSDNTPAVVTLAELTEVLVLSGEAQAAIWVLPE